MEETVKKNDFLSICFYIILYSIAGFIIETTFGMVTKGVIESRKSFLYGPFCAIYGIGAVTMILFLKNEKRLWKLFIYGAIIGAIIEFSMSYFCEKIFGVKWWDYSNSILNVEGRTCLGYALSWGLLSIFLIKYINPVVDKYINRFKQNSNIFKVSMIFLITLFVSDAIISSYALKFFHNRIAIENNLNIENIDNVANEYLKVKKDNNFFGFINKYYDDEKMLKTYPNLMIQEKQNKLTYVDTLLSDIEPYYYRLGNIF